MLRYAEEKYRSIFNAAPNLILSVSKDGVILDCNRLAKEVLGYEPNELIGHRIKKIIHPDFLKKAKKHLKVSEKDGVIPKKECKLLGKDGKTIDVRVNCTALSDEKEKFNGTICIIEDITEQKRVDERLLKSEEKYRTIFENVSDTIIYVNKYGTIVDANDNRETFGRTPEDLIGKHFTKLGFFDLKDLPKYIKLFGEVIGDSRKIESMEIEIKHADGYKIPVEVSVEVIKKNDKTEGFVCMVRNITERKKIGDALRKSEEKFRNLIENAPIGIYYNDFNGTFIYGNKKAEEIVGYKREELIGKSFLKLKLLGPKDITRAAKLLALNKLGKLTGTDEFALKRGNGTEITVEIDTNIINVAGKKVVLGMVQDVTERKKTEELLKESEVKYRSLVESSIDGIVIVQDKKVKFVNNALVKMLGYQSKDEINDRNFTDFVAEDYRNIMLKRGLAREKGKNVPSYYQFKALRKDGTEFHTEISVSRITYGGNTARQGIIRDVTERKKAEEELRSSEKQSSAAIEAARALTFNYDIASGKINWNGAIEDITGCTKEEFVKIDVDGWTKRLHPDDRDRVLSILQEAIKKKDRATAEYRFKTKKGYVVLSSISLTEKENGKAVRLVGILQDVTEQKKAEEELKKLNQELRKKIIELEKWERMTVGREVKMVELKEKIKELEKELKAYRKK